MPQASWHVGRPSWYHSRRCCLAWAPNVKATMRRQDKAKNIIACNFCSFWGELWKVSRSPAPGLRFTRSAQRLQLGSCRDRKRQLGLQDTWDREVMLPLAHSSALTGRNLSKASSHSMPQCCPVCGTGGHACRRDCFVFQTKTGWQPRRTQVLAHADRVEVMQLTHSLINLQCFFPGSQNCSTTHQREGAIFPAGLSESAQPTPGNDQKELGSSEFSTSFLLFFAAGGLSVKRCRSIVWQSKFESF